MTHRHLNHHRLTPAAIDDIIVRGGRADWVVLRDAVRSNHAVRDRVRTICVANTNDPYAQRYYFWLHYVQSR